MKILYTGFKGKGNSSCKLMDFFRGESLLLTNSFCGLKRDIDSVSDEYDKSFMFGIDKSLKGNLRIELCAEREGEIVCTALNATLLLNTFYSYGLRCNISKNPTHYLCNEAYFYMLQRLSGQAVFIHIPPMKYLSGEKLEIISYAVKEYSDGIV